MPRTAGWLRPALGPSLVACLHVSTRSDVGESRWEPLFDVAVEDVFEKLVRVGLVVGEWRVDGTGHRHAGNITDGLVGRLER